MNENGTTEDMMMKVIEALGINLTTAEETISILDKWKTNQKYLPEIPRKHMVEIFLILNKFNVEVTKKKLIMYYRIRKIIPDLFENKNPRLPHMQKIMNSVYFIPLPKITSELHMINIFKIIAIESDFSFHNLFGQILNIAELKLISDEYAVGEQYIYDLEGISLRYIFKIDMEAIRNLLKVAEKVYSSRIKGIHFINGPTFVNVILSLMKGILKPKLAKRIYTHKSYETLSDFIPKNILPKDYGGEEKSLEELNEMLKNKFSQNQSRFDELDQMMIKPIPEAENYNLIN